MVRDALSTQEVYHRPLLGLARLKRGLGAFRPRQTPTVPGPPKIIEWGGAPRLHKDLENAIKERVKRLLNADIIDITPLETSIEEELGFAKTKEEDEEGVDDGSTEQN
jgi:hypothetical protein